MNATTVGVDLAKDRFELAGADDAWRIVSRESCRGVSSNATLPIIRRCSS
jgi:hypothetical protein